MGPQISICVCLRFYLDLFLSASHLALFFGWSIVNSVPELEENHLFLSINRVV